MIYRVPGYEPDDLRQEAAIALWRAGNATGALARTVVERRMIQLLRDAKRDKRRLLDETVRHLPSGDAIDLAIGGRDPAQIIEQRDRLRRIHLTALERRALVYVIAGIEYRGDKTIDNAIQRARRKLAA